MLRCLIFGRLKWIPGCLSALCWNKNTSVKYMFISGTNNGSTFAIFTSHFLAAKVERQVFPLKNSLFLPSVSTFISEHQWWSSFRIKREISRLAPKWSRCLSARSLIIPSNTLYRFTATNDDRVSLLRVSFLALTSGADVFPPAP